ncbi:MAG: hypothetical protein KF758_09070 [Anaerolineales bacterium]|nr:hypothetical protein [Anaerolineales bacterium]
MTQNKQELERVESITTIVVNIGTIISWLFSLFTFFVLAVQPEPISLKGLFELNWAYKILFLSSIFLAYIQVLRRFWLNSRKSSKETEGTFGAYLFSSLIKFKRPLVLLGFFIIVGVTTIIIFETDIFFASMLCVFSLFGTIFLFTEGKEILEKIKRQFDDDFRKKWLKRVKKQLHQDGYAHTANFINLPHDMEEINWAIKTYFELYEFEQDLVFSQKYIKKSYETYEVCEIRFEHVKSQLSDE